MGRDLGLVEEIRPDVLDVRTPDMAEEIEKEEAGLCFIPDRVSVGLFDSNEPLRQAKLHGRLFRDANSGRFGFVTCRFRYGQWVSSCVFERLTHGYKPSVQLDSVAQLTKAISGAVQELDNSPVGGFRLVTWLSNPYGFCTKEYSCSGDVVLEDPRGFMLAVRQDSFFRTLAFSGGNIRGGVLPGKYVYGWRCADKALTLVPVGFSEFEKWKAWSDGCRTKEKPAGVMRKDLVPGRVYRGSGSMSGDWMYVGKMDTYSQDCHVAAFDNGGKYDIDYFAEQESSYFRRRGYACWPTTKGRLVFRSMKRRTQRYMVRADVRGVLSEEVLPSEDDVYVDSDGKPYLDGDGNPVTYERVMKDVGSSPAFHRIAFSDGPERLPLPVELTKYDYGYQGEMPDSFFPFVYRLNARITTSGDGQWSKVTFSGPLRGQTKSFRLYRNVERAMLGNAPAALLQVASAVSLKDVTLRRLCEVVRPTYPAYRLDNGRPLRPEHAVMFVPKDIRNCSANLF